MHPLALVGCPVYGKGVMMGDMADWIIENGELDVLYDEGDEMACSYCGQCGLKWAMIAGRPRSILNPPVYRLVDENGKVHSCPEYWESKK